MSLGIDTWEPQKMFCLWDKNSNCHGIFLVPNSIVINVQGIWFSMACNLRRITNKSSGWVHTDLQHCQLVSDYRWGIVVWLELSWAVTLCHRPVSLIVRVWGSGCCVRYCVMSHCWSPLTHLSQSSQTGPRHPPLHHYHHPVVKIREEVCHRVILV